MRPATGSIIYLLLSKRKYIIFLLETKMAVP
jgi:hypothetical protein